METYDTRKTDTETTEESSEKAQENVVDESTEVAQEAPQEPQEATNNSQVTKDTVDQVTAILNRIQTLSMKSKMSFNEAKECAQLCVKGAKLQPNSKSIWVKKLDQFIQIMDIRSVNGWSMEAQKIRKTLDN